MAWNLPFLSIWQKIAPIPPSIELVNVEASTIRVNVWSALGYAMIVPEHNDALRALNASNGLPVIGPCVFRIFACSFV